MRGRAQVVLLSTFGFAFSLQHPLFAEDPSSQPSPQQDAAPQHTASPEVQATAPWMEPIPVAADPELEALIVEVREALITIDKQMVRRKDSLNKTQDPATKTTLYQELDSLRKEREELERLLHDLVDEARLSEQTAIDEALAHARWLERQQEYHQQQEELIRDRQP